MAKGTHCFEILMDGRLPSSHLPGVIVLAGDDNFLPRETGASLLKISGIEIDEPKSFDGEECKWIDVHDELATMSL